MTEQRSEITFRDILPLFKGRTITGYATGALGDRLAGLTLTFDDKSWAQLTLSNPPGIRIDIYAADGKRIYSDWRTGQVAAIEPGTDRAQAIRELGAMARGEDPEQYEPPSHQRGAGDGTCTPADRCSLCLCALNEQGLCVDTLCSGSREDDDDYYARIARER